MKILQVSKKFPYPLKDGESLAIVNMAKGLKSNGAEVSLLAMNTLKHFYKDPEIPKELSVYSEIEKVTIDNRFKWTKFLFSFWSKDSFIAKKYHSNQFKNAIINILSNNEFNVIQLESIFLAQYIPIIRKHFSGLISLRTHNVESLIWERMAKNAHFLNKWIYSRVARKLKQFEIRNLKNPDLVIPISRPDNLVFMEWGVKVKSKIIPVGIETLKYNQITVKEKKTLQIGFIGALDWMPNIEGLDWFLKFVWKPFNLGKYAHLNIAGRNMPNTLKKKNLHNVTLHGEISSAIDFMMNNHVLIVPLLSGSGMRVKILEGMALGKVIVTSTLGAEGIPVNNGENIIIADTPSVYAEKIIELATHYEENLHIGVAAKSLIHSKFSNQNLGKQLINYYQQQLIAPLI